MGEMSEQHKEIVSLISYGMQRDEIAEELNLNPATVRTYIARMCAHFNCSMKELPVAAGLAADDD
jgi:DNA-binding NarL/FixJ family response regulator